MILIVVKWTIRPEYADSWMDRVADFTAGTRAEPGNIFFEWNRNVDDPNVLHAGRGLPGRRRRGARDQRPLQGRDVLDAGRTWPSRPRIINTTIPQDGWSEMAEVTPR